MELVGFPEKITNAVKTMQLPPEHAIGDVFAHKETKELWLVLGVKYHCSLGQFTYELARNWGHSVFFPANEIEESFTKEEQQ